MDYPETQPPLVEKGGEGRASGLGARYPCLQRDEGGVV